MSTLSPAQGPTEARVRTAIAQAAAAAGVDFAYLYNQARVESSLDPRARAATSSAAGLFQFTGQTWLAMLEKHGAAHGLGWAADAIERVGKGYAVRDPALRGSINDLRFDPDLSSAMAAELAADNRAQIEAHLGRPAEPVDLYLAHFLGSAGATSFLTAHDADPEMAAAPLFPAAAAANRAVFYSPSGAPRSLGDIRDRFAAKLRDGPPPDGPVAAPSYFVTTRHDVAVASERAPLELRAIEPMPQRLSVVFAARAYRQLAALSS